METDTGIIRLKRELRLKQFQFDSIFEFSETLYTSFQVDNIIRIYFSTLMGQLGVSRLFFYDPEHRLFEKRGFGVSESEMALFKRSLKKMESEWFYLEVENLAEDLRELKEFLVSKKIYYLVNISETERKRKVLGLGLRFNRSACTRENIEFAYFVSRFSLIAIENAFLINRLIESKRVEHELKIARDIQLSLLPQEIPRLKNFEIGVIYEPIHEVGGDYYDILRDREGLLPILIADVEGKGLPAALLAASSQAIFRSLSELYFFGAEKFIAKANSLIFDFTKGNRFITLFWMLLDDERKAITYVNAGHVAPSLIRKDKIIELGKGGFLTGFIGDAEYEMETVDLKKGDIVVAYTDGVPEVENEEGEEFGEQAVVGFLKRNKKLPAQEMAAGLLKEIRDFSQGKKFRDDFTLIILKAR